VAELWSSAAYRASMGTQAATGSPQPHEKLPGDAAHLDADAECLEDPVHCGDAHHQHDARAAASPPADETRQPRT
jgi:hypothetical protein